MLKNSFLTLSAFLLSIMSVETERNRSSCQLAMYKWSARLFLR